MPDARAPLAPGVYFGLDDETYHADPALGSGDMRRLAISPFDFWWGKHGYIKAKESPALIKGRAFHTAVLEGLDKFKLHYGRKSCDWNTKAGHFERASFDHAGLIGLDAEDYDRIAIAATVIRANPHLRGSFDGGAPEVSVVWERGKIRRKARLDYLKPRAVTDLKSIRNTMDVDFRQACRQRFASARYYTQAVHYLEARALIPGFIRDGAVFGTPPAGLLDAILASDEWAFVFVFLQAEGAPLTWGMTLSPANPMLDPGRAMIETAERNWAEFSAAFAPGEPWLLAEPLEEADINDFPAWYGR